MWLNELYQRWTGQIQTNRRARRAAVRQRKHLTLEALEDRNLLSAPVAYTVAGMSEQGASQFNLPNGGNINKTAFLGGNFNAHKSVGGTTANVGASAFFKMSGTVGLGLYANVSAGTISASYGQFTLNQNQSVEPTAFGQEVNFTPQNTNVSYSSGSFSTTPPSVSAGVNLEANVNATIGGKVGYLFGTTKGSKSFSANFNQPIAAYSTTGSLSLFGQNVTSMQTNIGTPLDSYVNSSGVPLSASVSLPPVTVPLVDVGPIALEASVGLNSNSPPNGLQETLELSAGLPGGATVNQSLGSASQSIPNLPTLSSSNLQTIKGVPGILKASGGDTFASLSIQTGPLLAALFDFPLNPAAIADTYSLSIGNFGSLDFTPISFTLNPGLSLQQKGNVTPTNSLTYDFVNEATGKAMKVDVTKNGVDQGLVSSITFIPGQDNIGVKFNGTPIEVQPYWNYGLQYTNDVYLAAQLQGTLTVGDLTGRLGTLNVELGPLYQTTFNLSPSVSLATFYDKTFKIFSSGPVKLPSFVIGDTFTPSMTVNTTADNNMPYNSTVAGSGSLRAAIESANLNYKNGNHGTQIITLGPGTYDLSIPATGSDDSTNGHVNIASNLIIQGAGIGQTIINASGLGDSMFKVGAGYNLTLQGVTLENGGGTSSTGAGIPYYNTGGAIDNAGNLTIENSLLEYNSAAAYGGAIYNAGTATILDSTLSGNTAGQDGGGIFNRGTLTVSESTLSTNTADGFGGGIYNNNTGTTTINASTLDYNSVPANDIGVGGGAIFNSGALALSNSTLYGNSAFQGGGALYETNGSVLSGVASPNTSASLINDTITQNSDNTQGLLPYPLGGGIYVSGGGSLPKLANTIVVNNWNKGKNASGTSPYADDIVGSVDTVSSLNDLIGTGGSGGLTNGVNGNQVGVANPGLGTFGYHGGPTQTVSLLAGSPAIGAGNNAEFDSATDQRGYARVVGSGITAVDIGAYEYNAVPSNNNDLALSGSVSSPTVIPGGQITYTLTVTNNGRNSQTYMTLYDVLPADTTLVSWTAPPGWQSGIGLPYGSPNDTFFAWSNKQALAAGKSVTFTLVLQANRGTALGTALTNTASVGPIYGDSNPNNNSVTLTATVNSTNVTSQFSISPQSLIYDAQTGEYFTTVYIAPDTGDVNGPLALVITGLPAGVTMVGANGSAVSATGTFEGNPYVEFVPAGGTLKDHQSVGFNVYFKTTGKPITFGTEVLQGL